MTIFGVIEIPYALSGLAVGFVVGLSGVGGGALMTPLLVLGFGINPAVAVGTDLLYAAVTKACGTAIHHIGRSIDWRVMGLLAAGSIPATGTTLLLLGRHEVASSELSGVITNVLGYALLLTALSLVFRRPILAFARVFSLHVRPLRRSAATVVTGAVLGVLVTITSVGAGAIGVTILVFLYPHLPASRIVGTDIAHAVPLALIAGLGHWALGTVDLGILASLLTGSLPGVALGSLLAPRVPERLLRLVLATVLTAIGAMLAIK
jgi:uncharacterized membrane protein YfcA